MPFTILQFLVVLLFFASNLIHRFNVIDAILMSFMFPSQINYFPCKKRRSYYLKFSKVCRRNRYSVRFSIVLHLFLKRIHRNHSLNATVTRLSVNYWHFFMTTLYLLCAKDANTPWNLQGVYASLIIIRRFLFNI